MNPQTNSNQPDPESGSRLRIDPIHRYNLRSFGSLISTHHDIFIQDLGFPSAPNPEETPLVSSDLSPPPPTVSNEPEPERSALFDVRGVFDLSKIHPRISIKIEAARTSLRGGIDGILEKDKRDIPIARIVPCEDPTFLKMDRLRTTVVTKIKAGGR